MSEQFQMDGPARRFTVGTVGEPGHRVFLIQVEGPTTYTLKTEKQLVSSVATYLGEVMQDLPRPQHLPEDEELELSAPLDIAWNVEGFEARWAEESRLIEIQLSGRWAEALSAVDELVGDPPVGTFTISLEQAAAFAIRATSLVEAGRPPCPLCGYPIDPDGHACPRTNGHRPPSL